MGEQGTDRLREVLAEQSGIELATSRSQVRDVLHCVSKTMVSNFDNNCAKSQICRPI